MVICVNATGVCQPEARVWLRRSRLIGSPLGSSLAEHISRLFYELSADYATSAWHNVNMKAVNPQLMWLIISIFHSVILHGDTSFMLVSRSSVPDCRKVAMVISVCRYLLAANYLPFTTYISIRRDKWMKKDKCLLQQMICDNWVLSGCGCSSASKMNSPVECRHRWWELMTPLRRMGWLGRWRWWMCKDMSILKEVRACHHLKETAVRW